MKTIVNTIAQTTLSSINIALTVVEVSTALLITMPLAQAQAGVSLASDATRRKLVPNDPRCQGNRMSYAETLATVNDNRAYLHQMLDGRVSTADFIAAVKGEQSAPIYDIKDTVYRNDLEVINL